MGRERIKDGEVKVRGQGAAARRARAQKNRLIGSRLGEGPGEASPPIRNVTGYPRQVLRRQPAAGAEGRTGEHECDGNDEVTEKIPA